MSFGEGWESKCRSWEVAAGVREMAALRERRRVGREGDLEVFVEVEAGVEGGSGTGLDFWASDSVRLIGGGFWVVAVDSEFEDLFSFFFCGLGENPLSSSGGRPVMEVSGTLVLRGGGGSVSRE